MAEIVKKGDRLGRLFCINPKFRSGWHFEEKNINFLLLPSCLFRVYPVRRLLP